MARGGERRVPAPEVADVVEAVMATRESRRRLVYVGDDGDLYQSQDGHSSDRLTWGWHSGKGEGRLEYVWPSYSPDGSMVACFGVAPGRSPEAGLYAVTDDGVKMHELWRMTGAAPICESWSPDSRQIALLLQDETGLRLELADVDRPGRSFPLDRGSPLFWAWSPRERFIAVHAGGSLTVSDAARLSIFATDDGCREIARLAPGEFRSPAWSPDGRRLAYVDASDPRREYLSFYRLDDGVTELVCPVEGHCALSWSPDGRFLAYSEALGETPHLFTGVTLVDARTGRTEVVGTENIVGFLWSPCSQRLVLVGFADDGSMEWSVLDVRGTLERLSPRFYPSRELIYYCWFFDQLGPSHPLVSPDGTTLAFAGMLAEEGLRPGRRDSSVYLVPMEADAKPRRLAGGHFACWDGATR
ncbi:MAG: hypothetical protein D6815_07830 [Candidatus Dadabacteria bacterium]|nr:MAG: hypothetical protein D6815_07830 [Candidatus Dadabacteria bacterium]